MYRLISVQSLSKQHWWQLPSKNSLVTTQNFRFEKFGCLCGSDRLKDYYPPHARVTYTSRNQISTINAEAFRLTKKKKKKPKNKKFVELLQVTSSSTKETIAAVHKLKAKKLSDFIDEEMIKCLPIVNDNFQLEYGKYPVNSILQESVKDIDAPILFVGSNVEELNLTKDGLREIIDSFHTYKSFAEISEAVPLEEHLVEEMAEESELLEESLEIDDIIPEPTEAKKPKKEKSASLKINPTDKCGSRFKSKNFKTQEQETLSKQKSLSVSLGAFLDCCVSNGMLNRGYITLLHYRYKYKKITNAPRINNICLFNILLHGYAEKENLTKVREIISLIQEDQLQMTAQSFAAVFEVLGRIHLNSNTPASSLAKNHISVEEIPSILEEYAVEAKSSDISLNDLIDKSIFLSDQRDVVLHAIRLIEPTFEPIYTPPNITYNNKLLNQLNKNVLSPDMRVEEVVGIKKIEGRVRHFKKKDMEKLAKEQLENELTGFVTVNSIQKFPEPTPVVQNLREKLLEVQKSWHATIINAFSRDINTLRSQAQSKMHRSINLLPYLRALEIEDYAEILLREVRMLAEGSETYSPTVGQLYKALGLKVQVRYHLEQKKLNGILQKTGHIYEMYCDNITESTDNPRQMWQRLVHQTKNDGPCMNAIERKWPSAAQIGVGKFLYNILMRDLKINVNAIRMKPCKTENVLPAFYTLFRNQGRIVKEEVKPHPVLSRLYRGSQQQTLTFETNLVPMLCPPKPWCSTKTGGYLLAKSDLIRLPQQALQQLDRIAKANEQDLFPSLDSLNQLSSVPWNVNKDVLDVILEVFNNGGNEKLEVPEPPHSLPPIPAPDRPDELSKTDKFQLFRQKLMHRRKQGEMYSMWCDALYRLSLANHFRDKVFYLPHNMDFRGRVYPIPPHLNHLGSDLARSLLVFHETRPLGKDGFSWLKLHCINLTGLKKRDSVIERLLFAQEIMDDILDSADNPLDGKMWWAKSEEPWQTLACCIEIAKVHRSPDPEKYMSSFPIHQDGSCNGLQHYAALGRDSAGAGSVNLAPADVPQDVYSGVAALVEAARQKDADEGVEIAKILENFVRRKVIKQTVMTTVYGVTRYGARLQIAKQLKDIEDFPKDWVWPASSYLTNKTFDSIREMFTSTKEIQDWLTDCARLISTVRSQNVEWVTPLGLPVVQPYSRFDKIKSFAKATKLNEHFTIDTFEMPNTMKQKNAFPPNFIHSLDSSHMMLTSLHCERAGMTFISVHDCFWTHACNIPEMNKICRQQFVALHAEPILEELALFMHHKYSFKKKDLSNDGSAGDMSKLKLNRILRMVPDKGDFDLEKVLRSIYFFS